ncbi:HAEPLYID family protein [Pleomorphovibrio marinus]|uniref:HAEPLYID family protein n=1 Tax=Pleomorphovibrio marinus TaxID=2164132 RepID=UPI000E0BF355|nr:HAEPLYID family protein [Pleomorphovibrio marinus]
MKKSQISCSKALVILLLGFCFLGDLSAQVEQSDTLSIENVYLDSLFINEIEQVPGQKPKVLHAEPLYIDLIRDLGARKGEKEWNFAVGMNADRNYNEYEALVEYEWAPIDRLGFEIEVPMTFYGPPATDESTIPSNRIESLKLATQWSFFVSEKASTTLALGYIHEFEIVDVNKIGQERLYKGNIYNPFFIAAKRWGMNYHTLIYTGPRLVQEFNAPNKRIYEINTNLHYMITGTRNFIGMEINKELVNGRLMTVMRPQMRVALAENLMVGIVSGIPLHSESRGISSFARIIYEPGFRAMH